MKKFFLILCALLLTWIGANAQVDYTSYLDNGTWTRDANSTSTAAYQGGQERYGNAITGSTSSPTKVLYETVTGLPAGEYTLTFYAVANNAWVGSATGDNIAQVYVTANGTTQTEDVTVYDQTACGLGAYLHTFTTVTVGNDGTLEYGLRNIGNGGNWYVCQAGSLTRTDETASVPTVDDKVYGCTAELTHWVTTGNNGTFVMNDWSTEDDASGMKPPFLQSWIANGSTLTAATISHRPLVGLAKGYYEVSMDIRIFSEAGNTIGSGTTFNANGVSEDLLTGSDGHSGTYGTETEVYGTYDLTCYVGSDGTLDISIDIPSTGVTYNWIAWKNLSVVYIGDEMPDERHACTAEIDHWTTTGNNGTHEVNTWSDEGESDGSGMTTPFCQNWVYNSTLSAATISHNTLTGLEPGVYTVSMDIRIYSEGGSAIGTGTTFSANGVSEDIATGTDANPAVYNEEVLVYGTYTLTCVVYDDGTLDISINIPDGVSYNWIAWKNLSVTYSGPITEPAIGEATASKTVVTPGEEVTITFKKVAPSEGSYTLNGTGFTDNSISVSYSGEGVFTFTVPDNVESGSTFTITIPAGQLYYSDDVKSTEQTLTFTVPFVLSDEMKSGMFLQNLYNNDLLSRGKDLGTRADVDFVGIPVTLTMNDDGKYTIWYADVDIDNATSAYLYGAGGAWAYADADAAAATAFSIEEVKDASGNLLGYHFVSDYGLLYRYDATAIGATDINDDYALAVNGFKLENNNGGNYAEDSQAIWNFVDINTRNSLKAAWVESQKLALAEEAGLSSITSGDAFDSYVANLTETMIESDALTYTLTGWTATNSPTVDGNGYGVEAFQKYARMQRTITGLTPGLYKVTLNGLDRNCSNVYSYKMYQNGYTDLSESYLYANGYEINILPWGSEATYTNQGTAATDYTPDSMSDASGMFGDGTEDSDYLNTLYTYVGDDGNLEIDIALLVPENSGWAIVKNYKLYYLGEEELEIGSDDEYAKGDEVTVDDGTLYTVVSDNLFTNGGFNDGVKGWTAGNGDNGYTDALATNAVKIFWGGFNGNPYIALPQAVGAANAATPTQAMAITSGKQYLFIGYTNGNVPTSDNMQYSSLFEMSAATTEVSENEHSIPYVTLEWGADAEGTATEWTKTMEVFDASTGYAGMRMNWSTGCYDGFQLYEVEEVPSSIEWTMTDAEWGTLILPFDATLPTQDDEGNAINWKAYSCASLNGDELTLTDVSTLAANTPYILNGTPGTYTFKGTPEEATTLTYGLLTGTLVNMVQTDFTSDGSQYVLQKHESDTEPVFYPITSESTGVTLGAYHCYLTVSDGASGLRGFISFPSTGDATGIEAVESETLANGAIYDLSGRKVSKAVKGVYIMNGKKVMVK